MNQLKSVELWCFVLLIANLATAGADFYFRRTAVSMVPFPPGQALPGAPGITTAGSPPARGAPCHLVRYASVYCGYCSAKYSQAWNELEKVLTRKGCDAIIVSPYSGDLPLTDGKIPEQRIAGVSLQFAKSARFTSTPITLLTNRDWRIVWSHIGVLGDDEYRQAVRMARF